MKAEAKAVLIAGPTASGKSALAVRIARRLGGVVINADSMQVYSGLRVLSARPGEADMGGVEHRLYGHVRPGEPYSAGAWIRDVEPVLRELRERRRLPIFCGGTGLYFKALLGGFDELPEVPAPVRDALRQDMAARGPGELHRDLGKRDPETARRIRPSDPQRILRALELITVTGRPLADLQRGGSPGSIEPTQALKIVLVPPRPLLRERIAIRFDGMLREGAIQEAEAFARLPGAMDHSAKQAIGVAELLRYRAGELSLEAARDLAVTRTRQYAKRQETWFRNQFDDSWLRLESGDVDLEPLLTGTGAPAER